MAKEATLQVRIGIVFTIFGAGFSVGYAIGHYTKKNRPGRPNQAVIFLI